MLQDKALTTGLLAFKDIKLINIYQYFPISSFRSNIRLHFTHAATEYKLGCPHCANQDHLGVGCSKSYILECDTLTLEHVHLTRLKSVLDLGHRHVSNAMHHNCVLGFI